MMMKIMRSSTMTFGDNNDEKYSECVKIIEESRNLMWRNYG